MEKKEEMDEEAKAKIELLEYKVRFLEETLARFLEDTLKLLAGERRKA